MDKMRELIKKVKDFLFKGFKALANDTFSFKVWHILIIIFFLFFSIQIYNFSLDVSTHITNIIPITLHDYPIVIFLVFFTPMFTVGYILSKFVDKISFRAFRYLFLSLAIFSEIFIKQETGIFSKYIYFYITIDTLIYLLRDKSRKEE